MPLPLLVSVSEGWVQNRRKYHEPFEDGWWWLKVIIKNTEGKSVACESWYGNETVTSEFTWHTTYLLGYISLSAGRKIGPYSTMTCTTFEHSKVGEISSIHCPAGFSDQFSSTRLRSLNPRFYLYIDRPKNPSFWSLNTRLLNPAGGYCT